VVWPAEHRRKRKRQSLTQNVPNLCGPVRQACPARSEMMPMVAFLTIG
jgi:hypothetical protein